MLSPLVWFSAAQLRYCVRHSRAYRMRAQNAVPPHSHVARVPSLPHYRDWLSSLTLGGAAAVYQCQGFLFARYCRESQGSSRCRRSPESDLKSGAAGLKHLPTAFTGAAGLKILRRGSTPGVMDAWSENPLCTCVITLSCSLC